MKALIVDADPAAAEAVRASTCQLGLDPIVAATGAQALAIARGADAPIALVVISVAILDGLVTCRRLARLLPNAAIFATAAQVDEALLARAYDAGAHDLLTTPHKVGELVVRAREALRIRKTRARQVRHEQRLALRAERLEQAKRELERTACIDQVTGIANRMHFQTVLHAEWRRAARQPSSLSLVLFDLDDFHAFNSRYGHLRGDACLARVTRAMAHSLRRASDVLARYGGEEFVAILPDTDAHGACVVAERLRARVEELALPHMGSRCSNVVTLSAGVASRTPAFGIAPEVLVEAADSALYRAKHDGRNRCHADGLEANNVVVARQPWPICPVVVLDPVLVQRVPRVLQTLRDDLRPAVAAATIGDLVRPSALGSRLRRASDTLGFEGLGELAARIDDTVRRGDHAATIAALGDVDWYLGHVQVVYRRPTGQLTAV